MRSEYQLPVLSNPTIKKINVSIFCLEIQVKMAVQVNEVLKSSHNHMKITTELQNKHHSEQPKLQLNGSPTIRDLKKKAHRDWQERQRGGEAERAGSSPSCSGLKYRGICWLWRSSLKNEGPQTYTRHPGPGFQSHEEKSP